MAHKIVLTGFPKSPLRSLEPIYTFDMTESSGPVPKGLPKPENSITYTVFLNQKQLKKIEDTLVNFETTKYMIQGEPTLDVAVSDCPGEIGVLCSTIQVIPDKKKDSSNDNHESAASIEDSFGEKSISSVAYEEVAATSSDRPTQLSLNSIKIPDDFLQKTPRREKVLDKIQYIQDTGKLDQPIVLDEANTLVDRYTRYLAAKELNLETVEVTYK
ncbi:plasmid stabilization protein [Paenibacillus alvei]|uniref:Plasmid stabilization protein n=1 Tax=Paenibacillus alvei TaxID=44250 RepID=A0ABT4H7K4_PAEAL|nr:hypothetical protein [Paenibacillus alvei]EJW14324.1 hypothetical protein PAV_14c00170 [Paenibacillus alvei DSM 29]MCY9541876.1 plasmid stabilization protein [Paenibacillus alvei]MCY9737303.1 plasmid stabilization protein [Paenibacillus alvei]MCY9757161.1 plasmid stabilization protein [Paenibacillus alvei]MCY9764966.1 plasmid stabilization protein [Paenibacillus alvei]